MVDFDNEATITTAPKEIVKIILLERRKYLIDALELVQKSRARGIIPDFSILSCRLLSLYMELYHALKEYYTDEERKEIEKGIESNSFEGLKEAFVKIDRWYYEKKLIKIDTIKKYDRTSVEEENRVKGV